MKIRYIETTSQTGDPVNDENNRLLIITADDLEIRVYGYGCGLYVLRLAPCVSMVQDGYDPDAKLREICDGLSKAAENTDEDVRRMFGIGLGTWCSPETIAYVVTQVLNNQ